MNPPPNPKPPAGGWEQANIDFYDVTDSNTGETDSRDYFDPSFLDANHNLIAGVKVGTDSTDSAVIEEIQTMHSFGDAINVYFVQGISPPGVTGRTIIADGTDRRTITISDLILSADDVGLTIAHELGHALASLPHAEQAGLIPAMQVTNAVLNNPLPLYDPNAATPEHPEWYNMMFGDGENRKAYYITNGQGSVTFKNGQNQQSARKD